MDNQLTNLCVISQTCRQRKLKCDEIKPECGQCRKASRHCVPSDGVVFRHQQNASMNGGENVITGERSGRLGAFYAYRNTFDESSVWVNVPKNGASYSTEAEEKRLYCREINRIGADEVIHYSQ